MCRPLHLRAGHRRLALGIATDYANNDRMKVDRSSGGILVFATLVAISCNALKAAPPYQRPMLIALMGFAIGFFIGLASLFYFRARVVRGNFLWFCFAYWLIGSAIDLSMVLIAIGLELFRAGSLLILAAWTSALSWLVFSRAPVLVELGIGILVSAFLVKKYQAPNDKQ
jgi:hypothetical protein